MTFSTANCVNVIGFTRIHGHVSVSDKLVSLHASCADDVENVDDGMKTDVPDLQQGRLGTWIEKGYNVVLQ